MLGANHFVLSGLDQIVLAAYLLGMFLLAYRVSKKDADASEYFLAGRSLGWVVIGFSLFASNISSSTLVGLAGASYQTGISISNYEWMASVILVFFAIFFIPYYLSAKIFTIPEFLECRFSPGCRYYFSALTIIGNIFIDTAGTLYAGSLVVQFFFPEVALWQSASLLALCAGLYTALGGLAAVVYTDVMQACVLLFGSTVLTYFALEAVGGWGEVVANTPPEYLSMIRPLDDPTMPWLGTLLGVPILGFYFWCTNQFIVQRVLGARDIEQARWGALFGGFLKLFVLFIMVFPGVTARLLYPELSRVDMVYPMMLADMLPSGLRGLVLAGLLAAIMSSIDSTLNSASTLVCMDFLPKLRPRAGSRELAKIGRWCTLVFMLIAIAWVPVVQSADTLFAYLQTALAYLFPPVAVVFLLGFFSKRTTSAGALWGMIAGHLFALAVAVLQYTSNVVPPVHFLILTPVFFFVSAIFVMLISLLSAPCPEAQLARYTWSAARAKELNIELAKRGLLQDYRAHSVLLLLLTAVMVWVYR